MNKETFYKEISKDGELQQYVIDKYTNNITKIIDLIKLRDSMKNPDADMTENVVDVDVISIPLLAALIDAHYQGMYEQYKITENE